MKQLLHCLIKSKTMRKAFLLGIVCILTLSVVAQNDSIVELQGVSKETKEEVEKKHSPKTASILSAVLPGTGQIYNGSWWKTPIVYAGFAGLGYGLYFYQDYYSSFKKAYNNYRNPYLEKGLNPPSDTVLTVRGESGYSPLGVQQGRDYYRKYRDLCVIGVCAWYIINILDAYVEAHLFEFDVSDDLTIQWQPTFNYVPVGYAPSPLPSGVRLSLQF